MTHEDWIIVSIRWELAQKYKYKSQLAFSRISGWEYNGWTYGF